MATIKQPIVKLCNALPIAIAAVIARNRNAKNTKLPIVKNFMIKLKDNVNC